MTQRALLSVPMVINSGEYTQHGLSTETGVRNDPQTTPSMELWCGSNYKRLAALLLMVRVGFTLRAFNAFVLMKMLSFSYNSWFTESGCGYGDASVFIEIVW